MKRKVQKIRKVSQKRRYPNGIFFSLLFFMSLIVFTGLFLTFILIGKANIDEISKYTRSYASTITESFTYITEKNYRSGKSSKLDSIYQKKIDNKAVYEAFFILNNGKIIAHSIEGVKKDLKGNIGNDEFAYIVDLILQPSWSKSRNLFFSDYNIMKKRPPYPREIRQVIKKVLYDKYDSPGWLVNKAVFVGKKPVGTVNFIISKDRIYNYIDMHVKRSLAIFVVAFLLIIIISFFITSSVHNNYRNISEYMHHPPVQVVKPIKKVKKKKRIHNDIVGVEMLPNYQENVIVKNKGIYYYDDDDLIYDGPGNYKPRKVGKVHNAIPVSKKR